MRKPKWGAVGGAWSVEQGAVPDEVDVQSIRLADRTTGSPFVRLTQEAFAKRYGFTLGAVQDWEQGRRKPGRTARILLELIRRDPAAVRAVLT